MRETEQEALEARVPVARLTEPAPAKAVAVPPQLLVKAGGVATTKPAGRVSVKASPVREVVPLGLVMVKVSEVVPLSGMVDAPKALVMVGGAATVKLAVAVFPVPPFVEVTLPVVLVY